MPRRIRTTFALIAALTAVAALPLAAQDWKGRGRLQGIVTADGKPFQGAKVTVRKEGLEDGPASTTTDAKGRWAVGGLVTGNWEIVVEAAGYVTAGGATKVIEASLGPPETLRVELRRAAQETQQATQVSASGAAIQQGNELLKEGKYAEARVEYEKAVAAYEENEKKAPVLLGIAQTYAAEGKKGEAIKTLEQAVTFKPGDEKILRMLVSLLVGEGHEAEAQKYLAQLPQGATVDPDTLLNMGIEKYNAQELTAALDYFDRVVRENPNLPDAYYYRALVYLSQGKTAEAKADFQKLLELAPNHEKAAEVKEFIAAL